MHVSQADICGVKIVEPDVARDGRGMFFEAYNRERYVASGISVDFVQDNVSVSSKGTVRGLHFQAAEHAQAKLVSVLHGAMLSVGVDIRKGSPTFGRPVSLKLSAENGLQMFLPRGFAHVLVDDTVLSFKCDNFFAAGASCGLRFDDPAFGIQLPKLDVPLNYSERDKSLPLLSEIEPWTDK